MKSILSIFDLSAKEINDILMLAVALKKSKKKEKLLEGKVLGMIFDKPSTRTTVSFAVAMTQLGGFPLVLDSKNMQRQRGETLHDTALTLSRYLDGIVFRTFRHKDAEEFSKFAGIPVINGLTDLEHPCQVLGDVLTIMEKRNIEVISDLKKIKVVFVGDGNNISNSWLGLSSIIGMHFSLARPEGYGPDKKILEKTMYLAKRTGANIEITDDPVKAVKNADAIYTDVWTSMGAEAEQEKRKVIFSKFQVNKKLLVGAKKDCLVMHCLPAIRGEEITADVIDGKNSVVFDQAENRLHIQKAILVYLLK